MRPARLGTLVMGMVALAAAGCASTGEPDELQLKIQDYYAAQASEEDGACPTPEIASVTKRKVVESGAERTLLRVRYSYFDPSQRGDVSWSQVLIASKPCTGFAERDFTLERAKLGYRVVDMSGPRRVP
ncbi:MAG TPA: hypothetical protein VLE23_07005 [Geminicoccaceae bacterium]|nr:hypothetical protein [Geminicoccaceae bacterium]